MKAITWKTYVFGVLALVALYYLVFFILFWRLKRSTKQFLELEKEYERRFGNRAAGPLEDTKKDMDPAKGS